MSSEDEQELRQLGPGQIRSIERGNNQLRNTICLGHSNYKQITPKGDRKYSQDYFYETFNKMMNEKEIKLLNKEEGKDFKIILLQRENKDDMPQQQGYASDNGIHNQMIQQPVQKEEDDSEGCDLESSINSNGCNKGNSIIEFPSKFIDGLNKSSLNFACVAKDNAKNIDNPLRKIINERALNQKEQDNCPKRKDKPNNSTKEMTNPLALASINNSHEANTLNSQYKADCNQEGQTDAIERAANEDTTKNSIELSKQSPIKAKEPESKASNQQVNLMYTIPENEENRKAYETEFTFSLNHNRKYKAKDILSKKDFFQMRYLNQNLKNNPKLMSISDRKEKMRHKDSQNNFYLYIDNRNVIKFFSLYFKKIETAIFQFNTRQYDKAYRYLLDDNIIYSIDEFGEVLLLIQGFDKAIIGEFLSNEKSPNEKYSVTKAMLSKLDFKKEDFLPSFRDFLSLVILPNKKEGVLLEHFSVCYFNDNLDKEYLYKNKAYVESLCSLAIEANEIFKRQSKGVSRDDFILFHPNVDKEMSGMIYDEIKKNNINIRQDHYNEDIYKKLFDQNNKSPIRNTVKNPTINAALNPNQTQREEDCQLLECDLIALLKRGELFKQKQPNGTMKERMISFDDEKQCLSFKTIGCSCAFANQKRIYIREIFKVYRGSPSIRNNEHDNYITLILEKNQIELYNTNEKTIVKWFNGINLLIKQKHPANPSQSNPNLLNQNENNTYLSVYWTEIVNHWQECREFLTLKNRKSFNKAPKIASSYIHSSISKQLKLTQEDAAILWSLGLPKWIRNSLWKIILTDKLDICESLLLTYQRLLEEEIISLTKNTGKATMIREMISEINTDISELYEEYQKHILMKEETFKSELYIIIRGFCFYRPDVIYSNQIAYFAMMFYLNSSSYFEAFVFLINFIIPNCFFQFSLQDEVFANEYTSFFNHLLKKYLTDVHKHFTKFGITSSIFFLNWVGYLFSTTFEYDTVLRIWDNFLLKGNIIIFEVAIAIIKVQEKELLNSSISSILNNLKYFPSKYSEKELFNIINCLSFKDDFEQHFEQNEIGKEKGMLYQVYLN